MDIAPRTTHKPRRFVFVLMPHFTLLSFAAAVETLRLANRMAGRTVYTWVVAGEGGTDMPCSAGSVFPVECDLIELTRDDTAILCGGLNVQAATTRR
ncbi:MAG: GlxA family transcriptional regulator, partial [Paracoccaceae bacterium]